ncbi:MAG: hypothetical protein AMQ22_02227 [Candidatus Methanofastidiosum methylothiophilum]|uniref:Uncharacterized protein n=1 Tax=Candidatus Methanofastidiosum methylothiophilum TaxID=1705564 RepID=A0A150IJY0_9EURY|nr:MAG: hypothetical protein AMQ22_02227 [Candidatus Methanofastidiosum methylthiophilus]
MQEAIEALEELLDASEPLEEKTLKSFLETIIKEVKNNG